jgi:hypothetical protein
MLEALQARRLFLHLVIFELAETYVRGTVGKNVSSPQSEYSRNLHVVISTM